MDKEKETASNLIDDISWATKCAKEQADMLGYMDYQKEYHIRKTIAETLARVGYRKEDEVRKETAKEIFNALYHQEEIGFSKIKWFAKYYYDVEVDE